MFFVGDRVMGGVWETVCFLFVVSTFYFLRILIAREQVWGIAIFKK